MTPAKGQTLSHYRLVEEIGQGGMGIVYRALDTTLDRHVALKVLPPEVTADPLRLERFRREARAIAALNHPNIVTLHSVDESDGVHFLTMELVEGKTLEESLTRGGLPMPAFFDFAVPLAEALAAAHERGVIHRDLKPANIMVTAAGRVKLLDFGLARQMRPQSDLESGAGGRGSADGGSGPDGAGLAAAATRTVTRDGHIVGTIPYMSPEQLQGQPADARSDLFSLGIILYQMATGARPFTGGSWAEVTSSILRDRPAPLHSIRTDVPQHLGRILRRCLEKDPRRRYQSALDLRNELEDLRHESGGSAEPQGVAAPAGMSGASGSSHPAALPATAQPRRSGAWPIAIGLLVPLVALGGWAAWRWGGGHRDNPVVPSAGTAGTGGNPAQAGGGQRAFASIGILPFVNMGGSDADEYFSDGITEELINAMAKVPDLKVPARTSVFAFKGKTLSVQEIGRQLGVETVLEGSVRRSGETLRITAQLISVADGFHLWSERYDRTMKDLFAVQDDITGKIVAALRPALDPAVRQALQAPAPTRDVQAYDFYLKGRTEFHQGSRRDHQAALQMYHRAIEIDPGFALAYAGIADSAAFLYLYAGSVEADRDQADRASLKALELAPDLAEAHASRALALSISGRHKDAAAEFETAIRINPKLFEPWYFYAREMMTQGNHEEAVRLFEQAIKVRPEDYQAPGLISGVLTALGRTEESLAYTRKCVELTQRRLEQSPDDQRALYFGGSALVSLGEVDRGLEMARRAVTLDPNDPSVLYNVACIHALAHHPDAAIDYLEKSVAAGFSQRAWLENDSDLNSLRDLPRFKRLMAGFGRKP